jgi:hypothetical protein
MGGGNGVHRVGVRKVGERTGVQRRVVTEFSREPGPDQRTVQLVFEWHLATIYAGALGKG